MKNLFSSYYHPSDEQLKKLWNSCIFVLDTNVLLDLYRYSDATREKLLELLRELNDRLWVPYQVAHEFHRNRPDVLLSQSSLFDKAISTLREISENSSARLNKNLNFRHHPYIQKDELLGSIQKNIDEIIIKLEQQKKDNPDSISDDYILDEVTKIFENKVGNAYTINELSDIYKDGAERYKNEIPPGYKDASGPNRKDDDGKYGDLVLWYQCIDKAIEDKKPIILITNDGKADWWWGVKGKTISPRPELIDEMKTKAGVDFYMYSSDSLMEHAPKYINSKVDSDAIEEIRDVRKDDKNIARSKFLAEMIIDNAERFKNDPLLNDGLTDATKKILESFESANANSLIENKNSFVDYLVNYNVTNDLNLYESNVEDRYKNIIKSIYSPSISTSMRRGLLDVADTEKENNSDDSVEDSDNSRDKK